MAEILKGASVLELNPHRLEKSDLRIEGGRIVARAASLSPEDGDEVTDLSGHVVTGGLVVAHTHLYTSLTRGMPLPRAAPQNVLETLKAGWWKLEPLLDELAVEVAARVSAVEALRSGVTTLFDLHSSPSFVEGSLAAVRRGVDAVGLRSVLAWEVGDRHPPEVRDAALRETESFLASGQSGRCRGMVGAQPSWSVSDETLGALADLASRFSVGVHLHVAESPHDERETRAKHAKGVVERLLGAGVLGAKTILAHCTHLAWEELSQAQENGSWLVHNPRSNMERATGYAPAGKFGARKALGTDGMGADLLAEAQVAFLKSMEAGAPIDPAKWLAGGQTLASGAFGLPVGPIESGAAADLVVLDYPTAAPFADVTVASHFALGLSSSNVWSVMVDGMWRLWDRQLLSFDWEATRSQAQELSAALWKRMAA